MVGQSASVELVIQELTAFVRAQTALVAGVGALYGLGADGVVELTRVPNTGSLTLKSEVWDFKVHGGGIMFEERSSRHRVDVHVRIDDPRVFDAWRLGTYFRSKGAPARKLLDKATGTVGLPLDDVVAILVDQLVDAHLLEGEPEALRLVRE